MGEGKKPSEEIRYLSECGYYKLCQVDMDKILAGVESLEAEAAQNIQDLGTLRTQIEALQESNAQLREELKQAQYYSGEFEKLASDTQGRLDSVEKLMEQYVCWSNLDSDGLHNDPDECQECPYLDDIPDEFPCWIGKMKRRLAGLCG